MVKISKLVIVCWVGLAVALIMAANVAVRLWLPGVFPATGFKMAAKFLWSVLAIDLLVTFLIALFLAVFKKRVRIWFYDDLKDGRIFRKGNLSSEFGLLEIFDAEDEFPRKKKNRKSVV
jgi:hypothetical protein